MGVRVPPFAPGRFTSVRPRRPREGLRENPTMGQRAMQQAVQNSSSPLERNITVSVPIEQIEAEIAARLKQLARTVKMQGFRPGHVPLKMVERHYGFQVRQEVVSDSVQKSFSDAVRDQNYRVAGYPRFQPVAAAQGASQVEFTSAFEGYPKIVL